MRNIFGIAFALFVSIFFVDAAYAQSGTQFNIETVLANYKADRGDDYSLMQLDYGLMGDSHDIDTGSLSFRQLDVSIPGNSSIPVEFARRASGSSHMVYGNTYQSPIGHIWDIDIPYTVTRVDAGTSDICGNGTISDNIGGGWVIFQKYKAVSLARKVNIPGKGESTLGTANPDLVSQSGYLDSTKSFTLYKCAANGPNVRTPDGLTYEMGHKKIRNTTFSLYAKKNGGQPFRQDVSMDNVFFYATKVTDVHGNWVQYDYNSYGPTRIWSNDGREIKIDYLNGLVSKVTVKKITVNKDGDEERSWTYSYTDDPKPNLKRVTLPDGRFWSFGLDESGMNYNGLQGKDGCLYAFGSSKFIYMSHPSGTKAVFRTGTVFNVVKEAPNSGTVSGNNPCVQGTLAPRRFATRALLQKDITLLTGETSTWTYEYVVDPDEGSLHLPDEKRRIVIAPDGTKKIYYVRRVWYDAQGLIKRTEVYENANSTTPLRIENVDEHLMYRTGISIPSYGGASAPLGSVHMLPTKKTITQDGETYTTEFVYNSDLTSQDYSFAKPIQVKKLSTVSPTPRIRDIIYEHKKPVWILGLLEEEVLNDRSLFKVDYTPLGQVHKVYKYSDVTSPVATYAYNVNDGTLASATDALGRRTELGLWHRGQPQSITSAANSSSEAITVERIVDDNGWVISQTDARDYETEYEHDSMGRLTRILPSNVWKNKAQTNITTLFSKDTDDQITKIEHFIDKGYERQYTKYDSMHRPVEEIRIARPKPAPTPENPNATVPAIPDKVITTKYDELGRVTFKSLPYETVAETEGNGTDFTYDALGRIKSSKSTIDPDVETTYNYLANNCTEVIDPEGNVTTTCKDGYGGPGGGDVVKITQPEGVVTTMTYNIFGELESTSQTDSLNTQNYYYDTQRRLCRYTTPEAGSKLYDYDAAGQLTSYAKGIDGAGTDCATPGGDTLVTLGYDALGRLKTTDFFDPNTPDIWRDYDADGNLIRIDRGPTGETFCNTSAGANCWFYEYDEYSRLAVEELQIDDRVFETKYTYDGYGYLIRKVLPTGRHIPIINDHIGRTLLLGFSDDRFADTFQYHVNGQVKRFTYGNGQIYQSQQNTLQQTSRVFVQKPNTAWSVDLNYTYDGNGRVLTVGDGIDAANDRTYTYDGLGRLDTAVSPLWGTASYGYNAMGDLLTKSFTDWNGVSGANRTVTNSYDAATNRLTQSVDSLSGTRLVKYDNESVTDKRGNITTLGGIGFTYDMADQPITLSGSSSGTYAYDGNLKRVKSTVNGVTRYNVYDAAGMLVHVEELDDPLTTNVDESSETDYLHGAGMTLARIRTDATNNGVFTYLHPDHLGSPQAGTAETGTIAFREQYTPFGEALVGHAANDNQSGFTGHIKDSDTGLNYMQARYYDPNIGRFLSIDPVTFMDTGDTVQFNRYAYANNDPVNMLDPDGNDAITVRFADQKIRIPNSNKHFSQWVSKGHSGSLIVRSDGLTKYREYGRYPGGGAVSGAVRATTMPDIKFEGGVPTTKSLTKVFGQLLKIGAKAGSDDLRLSFDLSSDDFESMMETSANWDEKARYSVARGRTCHDFCDAVERSGRGSTKRSKGDRFKQKLTPGNVDEAVSNVRERYKKYEENRK